MAILSDRSIRRLASSRDITLEPFDEAHLGVASYDITPSNLFRINLIDGSIKEVKDRVITDGYYFANSEETFSLPPQYSYTVTTRSSYARCGLLVDNLDESWEFWFYGKHDLYFANRMELPDAIEFQREILRKLPRNPKKIPLFLRTYGTEVEIPKNTPVCQITISEKGTQPLVGNDLLAAMERGDVKVIGEDRPEQPSQFNPDRILVSLPSSRIIVPFEVDVSKPNSFHLSVDSVINVYAGVGVLSPHLDFGNLLRPVNSAKMPFVIPRHFYLTRTRETIEMGENHVGFLTQRMEDTSFNWHLNAPYIWPGSSGKQTLEIATDLRPPYPGAPGAYFNDDHGNHLFIFPLDQKPEKLYGQREGDKYKDQGFPNSRAHNERG